MTPPVVPCSSLSALRVNPLRGICSGPEVLGQRLLRGLFTRESVFGGSPPKRYSGDINGTQIPERAVGPEMSKPPGVRVTHGRDASSTTTLASRPKIKPGGRPRRVRIPKGHDARYVTHRFWPDSKRRPRGRFAARRSPPRRSGPWLEFCTGSLAALAPAPFLHPRIRWTVGWSGRAQGASRNIRVRPLRVQKCPTKC